MRLTPRAPEVKAVVELLESDNYGSAEALAKDVIKRVFEMLVERDWYVHAFQFESGPPTILWGPFTSETETEKFAKRLGIKGKNAVFKVFSPARQDAIDAENAKVGEPIICVRCGHPSGLHEHKGAGGRCVWRGCQCKRIVTS